MINDAEMREILARGIVAAAKALVDRVLEGQFSAADIAQLRGMFKDAGGSLSCGGLTTPAGDSVLDSLSNIDPTMLQ